MFEVEVGTIPCGFRNLTTACSYHLAPSSDPRFQLTFQIRSDKCGGNSMMVASYSYSQHMKAVNHSLDGYIEFGSWAIPCGFRATANAEWYVWRSAVPKEFSWDLFRDQDQHHMWWWQHDGGSISSSTANKACQSLLYMFRVDVWAIPCRFWA